MKSLFVEQLLQPDNAMSRFLLSLCSARIAPYTRCRLSKCWTDAPRGEIVARHPWRANTKRYSGWRQNTIC